MVKVSYKFNAIDVCHKCGFACPHTGVLEIMRRYVYTHVDYARIAYQEIDSCVNVVITILKMGMLCKCNNHITKSCSCKHRIEMELHIGESRYKHNYISSLISFSKTVTGLYSFVKQSQDHFLQ